MATEGVASKRSSSREIFSSFPLGPSSLIIKYASFSSHFVKGNKISVDVKLKMVCTAAIPAALMESLINGNPIVAFKV